MTAKLSLENALNQKIKCSEVVQGIQTFGISGPHWKKCCLGSHIKYIVTCNQKKSHHVLSKCMIFC